MRRGSESQRVSERERVRESERGCVGGERGAAAQATKESRAGFFLTGPRPPSSTVGDARASPRPSLGRPPANALRPGEQTPEGKWGEDRLTC